MFSPLLGQITRGRKLSIAVAGASIQQAGNPANLKEYR
jgi:hypothetical protein